MIEQSAPPTIDANRHPLGYLLSLATALSATAWALASMWNHSHLSGREDWDQIACWAQMVRMVVSYGEFPWWAPWNCGGTPLMGHTHCSVYYLLPISDDPTEILKILSAVHFLVACAGMHRLGWELFRSPLAALVGSVIFTLNGAMIGYLAAGHVPIMCIAYVPWAILFLIWSRESAIWGFALGATLVLAALNYLHYVTVYLLLLIPLAAALLFIRSPAPQRRQIALAMVAALGVLLAIGGSKVLLATQVLSENPFQGAAREKYQIELPLRYAPFYLAMPLGVPQNDFDKLRPEWMSYVGIPALAVFLYSLRYGWKWWHGLFVASWILAIGNSHWYEPSHWLEPLPIIGSLRVATRWRLVGMLALGLAAGQALSHPSKGVLRGVKLAVALALVVDLTYHAHRCLAHVFIAPLQSVAIPPLRNRIEQLSTSTLVGDAPRNGLVTSAQLRFIRVGLGLVNAYDPIFTTAAPNGPKGLGDPTYSGEFGPAGLVRQAHWSPNKIILVGPPGTRAWINQNAGSYWQIAGVKLPDQRAVDRSRVATGVIPASGKLEFRIVPPLRTARLVAHSSGLLIVAGVLGLLFRGRYLKNKSREMNRSVSTSSAGNDSLTTLSI